jgi:hypothetical protein
MLSGRYSQLSDKQPFRLDLEVNTEPWQSELDDL